MGKCVVVVKAKNGRIAAAYNDDSFFSIEDHCSIDHCSLTNFNGFIACVDENRECARYSGKGGSRSICARYSGKGVFWLSIMRSSKSIRGWLLSLSSTPQKI
jgi:hypothetical protein